MAPSDLLAKQLAIAHGQGSFPGDPCGFQQALAALLPIRQFQVETTDPVPFRGRLSQVRLGGIRAIALAHSAASWRVERLGEACVVLATHGSLELSLATGHLDLESGGTALYLPPGTHQWRSQGVNALVICLDARQLLACLEANGAAMDGWRAPRRFDAAHPAQAALLAALSRVVPLLDLQASLPGAELEQLQLDALLLRLVALLLGTSECADAAETMVPLGAAGAPGLAPLLHWIEGHLDRPITLGDLEQASGYSGRALQYAFKRRFGCGPMRWVRLRRLERAREVLLGRACLPSVSQLAEQVGYVNQSAFSRDFRQAFGVPPSALLGRGRG